MNPYGVVDGEVVFLSVKENRCGKIHFMDMEQTQA